MNGIVMGLETDTQKLANLRFIFNHQDSFVCHAYASLFSGGPAGSRICMQVP